MKPLNEKQLQLLSSIRRASDSESELHKSGVADVPGLVTRGSTVRSLERRGLVEYGGVCAEIDGDGFTIREDAPWYRITAAGREALPDVKWFPVSIDLPWQP